MFKLMKNHSLWIACKMQGDIHAVYTFIQEMFIEVLHWTKITIVNNRGTTLFTGFIIWGRDCGVQGGLHEGVSLKRAGGRWTSDEHG